MIRKETNKKIKRERSRKNKDKYSKKEIIEVFDKKKNKKNQELFCIKFKGDNRRKWMRLDNFDNNKRKLIIDLYSNNSVEKKEEFKIKRKKQRKKYNRLKNKKTVGLSYLSVSKIKPIENKLNVSDKNEFEIVKNCLEDCFLVKEEENSDKEKVYMDEIYDKDILRSIKIKNHITVKKKLLFSLIWKNKSTSDFYSYHYFEFEKLEKKIPCLLLDYMKKKLIYDI